MFNSTNIAELLIDGIDTAGTDTAGLLVMLLTWLLVSIVISFG
jgi:hypothetical protein